MIKRELYMNRIRPFIGGELIIVQVQEIGMQSIEPTL